jgi:hypothetical protein
MCQLKHNFTKGCRSAPVNIMTEMCGVFSTSTLSPVSVCPVSRDVFASRNFSQNLAPAPAGSEMQPAGAAAAGAIQSKHQAMGRTRLNFFLLFRTFSHCFLKGYPEKV